jgi:uncharacterized membrane protein
VIAEEPVAPSRLATGIPRDLEAICLKCLEKKPVHRYASARALAEDLERFLNGQPIVARRIGPLRRTGKWLRRHPQGAALLVVMAALTILVGAAVSDRERTRQRLRARAEEVAPQVREILERNCYECHGQNRRDVKRGLDVLNHPLLLDSARRVVVPGAPHDSRLLQRIADGSMPPEEDEKRRPRLAEVEVAILNDWILGGAPPLPPADPDQPTPPVVPYSKLAADAKSIFQKRCYKCHKYDIANGGIKILHHRLLVNVRQVVVPYRPEDSELLQLVTAPDDDKRMPPVEYNRLTPDEIATIRQWIAEGAPPFPRTE